MFRRIAYKVSPDQGEDIKEKLLAGKNWPTGIFPFQGALRRGEIEHTAQPDSPPIPYSSYASPMGETLEILEGTDGWQFILTLEPGLPDAELLFNLSSVMPEDAKLVLQFHKQDEIAEGLGWILNGTENISAGAFHWILVQSTGSLAQARQAIVEANANLTRAIRNTYPNAPSSAVEALRQLALPPLRE